MISIIIPVFNCEKYLDTCVSAIQKQTFSDWELIFSDDGSNDGGFDKIKEFSKSDLRIKFVHSDKSEGAGPARNKGIDAASGEFLMFIDADDIPEENMLELLHSSVSDGFDAAIGSYVCFVEGVGQTDVFKFEKKDIVGEENVRRLFAENFPEGIVGYLWNKIYRADIIRNNNIRFPAMRRLQDGVFNINYFSVIKNVRVLDDTVYRYRINPQTDMFRKCPPDYFDLIEKFSLSFIDAKKDWGNFSNKKIYTFFLNETGTCIENCFSPTRKMSKKERKEYFASIADNPLFSDAVAADIPLGGYRRFLIKNLRNYHILKAGILFKVRLKSVNRKLFYKLKG